MTCLEWIKWHIFSTDEKELPSFQAPVRVEGTYYGPETEAEWSVFMNYCSSCGKTVSKRVPDGEDRLRYICDGCGIIHYQNPKIVAGVIPEYDGMILLCRRAIEPQRGKWTIPAGYMENGETVADCARREAWEEAYAELADLQPYRLADIPHINQVYIIFRAQLTNDNFRPGIESLDAQLFQIRDIPWSDLAFRAVDTVLRSYSVDTRTGRFPFRTTHIKPYNIDNDR